MRFEDVLFIPSVLHAMVILNFIVFIIGACLVLRYNPMNYGCNLVWHNKFKMSLCICAIGAINLIYLWLA